MHRKKLRRRLLAGQRLHQTDKDLSLGQGKFQDCTYCHHYCYQFSLLNADITTDLTLQTF